MPIFTRSTGTSVLISHNNIRAVVAAIKSRPGQTTSDYRLILANDGVYVSRNVINLVLECTPEGNEVVRKGFVTRLPSRGTVPTWTTIKGAIVKQPNLNYKPTRYNRATIDMGSGVEAEIESDANSALQIAADAIMKVGSARTAAHVIDTLRDITHATASREDMRAKMNQDYDAQIAALSRTLASQDKLIALMERVHDGDRRLASLTFNPGQTTTTQPAPIAADA
jgi:hypothetical protein